jgi:hypothetical protein
MTTTNKGLAEPTYNSLNWDVPLNNNFTIIDNALGSPIPVTVSGTTGYALSAAESQNQRIDITGAISASVNVTIPDYTGGMWIVTNNTTDSSGGPWTVTVKTVSGTGVAITRGYAAMVYSTGTSVITGNILFANSDRLSIAGGTMIGNLALPSNGLNVGTGQLQVTGGNVTASGNITATGNVTAYSDQRLKDDIRTITDALSIVNQLRGVSYINKSTKEAGIGVVAQEVQNILPAVVHADAEGLLHVAYGNIVGLLINAIKELSVRVERLEARK